MGPEPFLYRAAPGGDRMHRIHSRLISTALVSAALAAAAPTAVAQSTPTWTCRASATYVNLVGNGQKGHIEPIVANGDSATGLDKQACQSGDAGLPAVPLGSDPEHGQAIVAGPSAHTAIKADLTYKQLPGAYGSTAHVVLAGSGHVLTAD